MQDKNVTIYGVNFDLSDDRFKDVKTLSDLEKLKLFNSINGINIREPESLLFNNLYEYQHQGGDQNAKVMTPQNTVNKDGNTPSLESTGKDTKVVDIPSPKETVHK